MSELKIATQDKNPIDKWIELGSEWFSPLLVKESRQALKSRQFIWTFFALLLVVACWTVGGLTIVKSEDGASISPGPFLLFGFWLILGFPLAIIIPFATFRSLAHEFEDGTLQLVSITTMKPYQIVLGKLGVAMLQIMIYVSVLAPCIAFTYLLRGVDVRQIWWGLMIAVTGSMSLCVLGLFLASVTKSRSLGIALSVLLLFGLAIAYWFWGYASYGLTYFLAGNFNGLGDSEASIMYWSYLGFISSTAFLLFSASAARIAFPADNRSSLIRIAAVVQTMFFMCIVISALAYDADSRAAFPVSTCICVYWLAIGSMMTAVPAIMSRRVRRSLPTTYLGRSVKSLFMPGPGRGYLFAVSNIWGWCLFLLMVFFLNDLILPSSDVTGQGAGPTSFSTDEITRIVGTTYGSCVYSTVFLSIVFVLMTASFRRRPNQGPFVGFALAFVLILACCLGPVVLQTQWFYQQFDNNYSILQMSNWFWTVAEFDDGGSDTANLSLIFATVAMLILGYFAMRIAGRELRYLPEAIPNRVMEEELSRRKSIVAKAPVAVDAKHPLD